MTDLSDFIRHAHRTIARAVAETGVNADLIRFPETIRKSVKRRVSAELKRLAILIRRLIFLMALRVELAPLVPRPASNYFEKADGEPKPRRPFFSVLPTLRVRSAGFSTRTNHGADARTCARRSADRPLDRHAGDDQVCRTYRANRLARTIQRWKAAGEARPYIAPIPKAYAMHHSVALVSGGLTVQLVEALKDWPSFDTS